MKGGNLSRHKRTKLGMLPGDVPIQTKAKMLEDGVRELDSRFDPTGRIGRNCAKVLQEGRGSDGEPKGPTSADRKSRGSVGKCESKERSLFLLTACRTSGMSR